MILLGTVSSEDLEDARDVAVPVGVKYESPSPFSSNHTIFSPTLESYIAKLDVVYSMLHSSSKLRLEYLIAQPLYRHSLKQYINITKYRFDIYGIQTWCKLFGSNRS